MQAVRRIARRLSPGYPPGMILNRSVRLFCVTGTSRARTGKTSRAVGCALRVIAQPLSVVLQFMSCISYFAAPDTVFLPVPSFPDIPAPADDEGQHRHLHIEHDAIRSISSKASLARCGIFGSPIRLLNAGVPDLLFCWFRQRKSLRRRGRADGEYQRKLAHGVASGTLD